ncbi:MAG: CCA tRNA nucleotidyltransferase [Phycisphaeraceae bacterium]|nr:CCA tRNA nucleotidyltransferase [Phycisphaeraceae bacterium]
MSESHARESAISAVRTLRDAGHIAYLAGGCVRDELLDLTPADYDVATDAHPDRVRTLFRRTQLVGASFGVVLAQIERETIEIATFRSDGPYSDRRRPDAVQFADPFADAHRRDFTVNALFLDPLPEFHPEGPADPRASTRRTPRGLIIDFVGGLADLERRVLRAVGDPRARLAEDHLRGLRAVRFASRLGFEIDEPTADAIRSDARDLAGVSRERIGDEVRRMLLHPSRAVAAWTLQYLGLDAPALAEPHRDEAPVLLGRLAGEPPYPTCLAAWALDRRAVTESSQIAGLVNAWRSALCLTNEERSSLSSVLTGVLSLRVEWAGQTTAAQKRAASSSWFPEALRIVAAGSPEDLVSIRRRVDSLARTPSGLEPTPLISGDDLILLGIKPGPGFQGLLDAIYDEQLEDAVSTRDDALTRARDLAPRFGL